MKNIKIILIFTISFIFVITLSSGKGVGNGIENCISNLMEISEYYCETESFIKLKKSNITFFKKLNKKGFHLKGITAISSKKVRISKKSKYPDFEIQIWSLANEKRAEETCSLVKNLITESSFFEKPPKIISYYKNYCIFLTTPAFSNREHIKNALKIIDTNISTNCEF